MKHSPLTLIATLLFSTGYLLSTPASAAVMLGGGLTHTHQLQPGATLTGQLELRNTGQTPEEIKLYQEDIRIGKDGNTEHVQGISSHPRSNASWINLPTDRVVLAPGARQTITYTLQVPNHGKLVGSYWSTLVLEPVSGAAADSNINPDRDPSKPDFRIQQRVRYAVQVISNIGNQGQTNLTFSPPRISKDEQGQRQFRVDIRNTGNQFTRPKVWLDVFDQQGQNIGRFDADPRGLFAGERENFQLDIASLTPGQYKALLAAQDNGNGQVFGSDINLRIQP